MVPPRSVQDMVESMLGKLGAPQTTKAPKAVAAPKVLAKKSQKTKARAKANTKATATAKVKVAPAKTLKKAKAPNAKVTVATVFPGVPDGKRPPMKFDGVKVYTDMTKMCWRVLKAGERKDKAPPRPSTPPDSPYAPPVNPPVGLTRKPGPPVHPSVGPARARQQVARPCFIK